MSTSKTPHQIDPFALLPLNAWVRHLSNNVVGVFQMSYAISGSGELRLLVRDLPLLMRRQMGKLLLEGDQAESVLMDAFDLDSLEINEGHNGNLSVAERSVFY